MEVVQLANHSEALEGLVSNKGFQPQRKPPVTTGGRYLEYLLIYS